MERSSTGISSTPGTEPLRRYARPVEAQSDAASAEPAAIVPYNQAATRLASTDMRVGSRNLLLALLRTGSARVFPGGGLGIEYGSLLKTAVRPDDLAGHVEDVARHLQAAAVDVLLVPGMSGYPVGAMYSLGSGIPAVLLKKQKHAPDNDQAYPAGSFAIPSYTGDGDVVMSADLDAVVDIVGSIVARELGAQQNLERVSIEIRCAGADDIIDKATMAHAITECAPLFCEVAVASAISAHRARTGDTRDIRCDVRVVSWVSPLIKRYNNPHLHLQRHFGITPYAGVEISSVHLEPSAIGVEGAGIFAFARSAGV